MLVERVSRGRACEQSLDGMEPIKKALHYSPPLLRILVIGLTVGRRRAAPRKARRRSA
jgi:hypothetical protein